MDQNDSNKLKTNLHQIDSITWLLLSKEVKCGEA